MRRRRRNCNRAWPRSNKPLPPTGKHFTRYTWLEEQTIIVKGEVKKEELFQVRLGPDGKPQRVLTGSTPASPPTVGKIRRIVKRNMTREYEEYAKQIGALAQRAMRNLTLSGYSRPMSTAT